MKRRRGRSMSKRAQEVTCFICKRALVKTGALVLVGGYAHPACLEKVRP